MANGSASPKGSWSRAKRSKGRGYPVKGYLLIRKIETRIRTRAWLLRKPSPATAGKLRRRGRYKQIAGDLPATTASRSRHGCRYNCSADVS
jgi:hypothetical protein